MPRTRPRRLSHVLMFTTDVRKAIEFYTRVLGLRLSDHSSDVRAAHRVLLPLLERLEQALESVPGAAVKSPTVTP